MLIKEFRIILPFTVEEYNVAQLWCVAEVSKNETGGGEGIEVLVNEPFDENTNSPETPLYASGQNFLTGQYTHKRFHLSQKVPGYIRLLAPKGSLEVEERAWNAYPYCRTVIENPSYMKDKFFLKIESMYVQDKLDEDNIHGLSPDLLEKREVVNLDIVNHPLYCKSDYDPECDPSLFQSIKTGRGPLVGPNWWENTDMPVMCAYKLVTCDFQWWGIQGRVESFLMNQEQRIFQNFHRQMFCWMDKWYGYSLAEIREIEEQVKHELNEQRQTGELRGMKATE